MGEPNIGPGGLFIQVPTPQQHQYLKTQSQATQSDKGWGDRLVYETGVCYGAGLLSGGLIGAYQGYKKPGPNNSKLRMNSVLNASARLGSSYSNSMAVFAMMYSVSRSATRYVRERNDVYNDVAGVATAGLIVGSTRGAVKSAGLGLLLGGSAAAMLFTRLKIEEAVYGDI